MQTFNASYVCGCAAGYTGANCMEGNNVFGLVANLYFFTQCMQLLDMILDHCGD